MKVAVGQSEERGIKMSYIPENALASDRSVLLSPLPKAEAARAIDRSLELIKAQNTSTPTGSPR